MMQDIAGCDYYNDLSQAQLIELVVSLQEQNLTLTRLLERATTAASVVAPTRLNIQPNFNFTTRSKSGTSASRYAPSNKEFPPLQSAGSKPGSSATTVPKKTGQDKTRSNNTKSSKKPSTPADPEKAKKSALQLFSNEPKTSMDTEQTEIPVGYTCVYLPINRKTKHSDLREKLRILKINLNRIFAIQRPAKNIVSLLVHTGYAEEIYNICTTEGISPITDFDPIAGSNLGDPKLIKTFFRPATNTTMQIFVVASHRIK
ncbi:hypothetical protein [Parasitella parasitica]|uniref:Uncharacterized protein n=1 Tax=Parasitella parasitica TaxID=35722 RepID=A0A0B7NGT5_9FUNG|nr:hypothetical protein [Parasitella parasitica]